MIVKLGKIAEKILDEIGLNINSNYESNKADIIEILRADLAKPSEWISVDDPPVYVLGFSVARKGWCVFTEDIEGVTMEYWAGPFSEQCVAESEIKRLEERTP